MLVIPLDMCTTETAYGRFTAFDTGMAQGVTVLGMSDSLRLRALRYGGDTTFNVWYTRCDDIR